MRLEALRHEKSYSWTIGCPHWLPALKKGAGPG
jgi:hypothetical protein